MKSSTTWSLKRYLLFIEGFMEIQSDHLMTTDLINIWMTQGGLQTVSCHECTMAWKKTCYSKFNNLSTFLPTLFFYLDQLLAFSFIQKLI